ncbi:unnamed protein product, partial [Prunus brigantina]
ASTVWRRLWEKILESHFSLPAQLAPSPIRPRRLSFTPHSAMPIEDSHGAQHHPPQEGTSQRRPSAEVNLQAEVELLRASVIKMSEKCDNLLSKNVELEHDYRTLKRNWERNQAQDSQRSLTQEPEHTQPNQPEHSHHGPPIQPGPSKGKGPLHPETTKSRFLRISPPRNRPHEPTKVYMDCRDRILDRQGRPILISVDLQDPKVTQLGPPQKPTQLPPGEGIGDSDNWGQDYSEDHEPYHTETFEEFYPAHGRPHTGPPAPETLPHADLAMRLLFEKVRRLESEQQRTHQPLWAKPRPGPFTERILNYHQEKEIQPLRIAFYTSTEDPLTHIHSFQSALGCKGLTDEGMCLLFPSTLSGAALNWFYRLNPCTINTFDSLKQAFLDHFMIQTDRLYSADDLYMLRQGEDEPLREYAASNPWNTYAELMKQAAVHAKAEYFNSKRGSATPARNPFANPPPASAPTPAPPQHSTPAPSTQDAQHPKRKDSYQHTFNNNKRGRHGNHHQSSRGNPHGTGDRAPFPFSPKP